MRGCLRFLASLPSFLPSSATWEGFVVHAQSPRFRVFSFSVLTRVPRLTDFFLWPNPIELRGIPATPCAWCRSCAVQGSSAMVTNTSVYSLSAAFFLEKYFLHRHAYPFGTLSRSSPRASRVGTEPTFLDSQLEERCERNQEPVRADRCTTGA